MMFYFLLIGLDSVNRIYAYMTLAYSVQLLKWKWEKNLKTIGLDNWPIT